MTSLSFTVAGEPIGKGRPRARVIHPKAGGSGFVQMYTPSSTRSYEAKIRDCCQLAVNQSQWTTDKADRYAMQVNVFRVYRDKGSDIDNYVKLAMDSINKVAFLDDRQVRELAATVRWDAANPRIEVTVTRLV